MRIKFPLRIGKNRSVFGGVMMIAGSSIGAGMLALPVITGPAGFFPALIFFVIAWLFMTMTALCLLEVNCRLGAHYSLISLAEKTLGKGGKIIAWTFFLFLFYSLGVAYIAASGNLFQSLTAELFSIDISPWVGSFLFALLFGFIVYRGASSVDHVNRALMIGLIASYCILIAFGLPYVKSSNLFHMQWSYAILALPILVISFGFHNMIPSLSEYFEGDIRRLRLTLIIGSALPLLIYLLFELVVVGLVPLEGSHGLLAALQEGKAATWSLEQVLDGMGKNALSTVADSFALFAIITSFLTQSLSLVDFLADGLHISKQKQNRALLVITTLAPPYLFAFIYPNAFIKALNFAGGFAAVILFGALPALMAWKLGKAQRLNKLFHPFNLFLLIAFSAAIFILSVITTK